MPTPPTDLEMADYLGVSVDESWLPALAATAIEIVDDRLGTSGLRKVGQRTYGLGIRLLASELRTRMQSSGGVLTQFGPTDGLPIRLGRDAWAASGAGAILNRFCPIGASG